MVQPTAERAPQPSMQFVAGILATLVAFTVLERMIFGLGRLPAAAYEQSFFMKEVPARMIQLARDRAPAALLIGGLLLLGIAVVADAVLAKSACRRRVAPLMAPWNELAEGRALRWFVAAVTGIVAWALSTYAYNAYFEQSHIADRVLLVMLWALLLWRPIFALPFALAATTIANQFTVSFDSYSMTELEVLFRIPILLGAFWIVRSFARLRNVDVFVFTLCCLIAATWWTSGVGKIRMGWMAYPHINLLLLGAYANGWLAFLAPTGVVRFARAVEMFRIPLMLCTLALECGALFLLWRRWSLLGFLAASIAFHIGAFSLSGIFFWKWILVDVSLLAFLLHGRRLTRLTIFSPACFALAVAVLVASRLWVPAVNLSWYDTPLTYSMRFEGVDAAGVMHELPAGFFRPYAESFVLTTFPYLSPFPQITGAMGITQSRARARELVAARGPEQIFAMERDVATSRYDSTLSARFDLFMTRFLRKANDKTKRPLGALAWLGAPRHLWTFPLDANWNRAAPIVQVHVVEVTSFYDGHALEVIRRRPVRTINVLTGQGRLP